LPAHLVNDPFDAVDEMLAGIAASNAGRIALTASGRGLYTLAPHPGRRVAIVVGGGSGHEPAFLGWVGPGFADGAAIGNVFASPSADPAVEVVHALAPAAGALFLFGNYEGDIMNFRLASALLADDGVDTETVLLTDDVASAPADRVCQRRGVAGGVIVTKIVSAFADTGASLGEVADMARRVNAATRTIGVALSSCHLPTASRPTFSLAEGEIDFGIGVHGEAGLSRRRLVSADATTDDLLNAILADAPAVTGSQVAVLVNTLGATPLLEAYIVLGRAQSRLAAMGADVVFAHAGPYLTSLQMAGVSLTLTILDDDTLPLLQAPAEPLFLPPLGGS
jgi:dihydroxyacetone kinase-like protein